MTRIKESDLNSKIRLINELTGSPVEPYLTGPDGRCKAQAGSYYLAGAYGGWKMERICGDGHGSMDPLNTGYVSKRDLYNQLAAFIRGLEVNQ